MLFIDGKLKDDVKRVLNVPDYINTGSVEKDVACLSDILGEYNLKEFIRKLSSWGNSYDKVGRALAVLEYVKIDSIGLFQFCWEWVNMMSSLNKPGWFDERNKASVKRCYNFIQMFRGLDCFSADDFAFNERFEYLVRYSLHRTIMQSLSHCFLIGLYASALELGRNDIVNVFKKYFDVDDEISVLGEIRFPLV